MIPMTDRESLCWALGFVAGKTEMNTNDVQQLWGFLYSKIYAEKGTDSIPEKMPSMDTLCKYFSRENKDSDYYLVKKGSEWK